MALITADRVQETTTTTGTGTLTLAGAVAGYRTFGSVCATGDTAYYYISAVNSSGVPTGDWETGLGTWTTGGNFARTTVHASSNAGSVVTLAAGTKYVSLSLTAASVATNANFTKMSGLAISNFGMIGAASQGATTIHSFCAPTFTVVDTSTAGTGASTTDSSNNTYKYLRRVRYTSVAATGRVAGVNTLAALINTMAGAPTFGRFPVTVAGAIADALTSATFMMGVGRGASLALTGTTGTSEPSAQTGDGVWLAADSTDTNMQIMHNDNAGTATKIDLGASFPVSQYVAYAITVDRNAAATEYYVSVTNLNDNVTSSTYTLTSNLPRTTVSDMTVTIQRGTMSNATAAMVDFSSATMGRF